MAIRHLTSIRDLSRKDVETIFSFTREYKKRERRGVQEKELLGKTVGLFFEKASTRTRISIEAAVNALGGSASFTDQQNQPIGKRESCKDFARTVSRYLAAVFLRTYSHDTVLEVAKYASIPVINGLSQYEHPCQALADLFTLEEKRGTLDGQKMAFIGDGNNVARSLALLCQTMEVDFVIASPKGYELADIRKEAAKFPRVQFVREPAEAARGADVLYADVWVSMGDTDVAERRAAFKNYQVNAALLKLAKPDALVMHCLPAHPGEEITDEVLDGTHSVVFDEAENRMHVNKGILKWILK